MGLKALIVIIIFIFIFLSIAAVLNWKCLEGGLKEGRLCLRVDYGLGEIGLIEKNDNCVCFGAPTETTTTPTEPSETTTTPTEPSSDQSET